MTEVEIHSYHIGFLLGAGLTFVSVNCLWVSYLAKKHMLPWGRSRQVTK